MEPPITDGAGNEKRNADEHHEEGPNRRKRYGNKTDIDDERQYPGQEKEGRSEKEPCAISEVYTGIPQQSAKRKRKNREAKTGQMQVTEHQQRNGDNDQTDAYREENRGHTHDPFFQKTLEAQWTHPPLTIV
jgi:hypothetical protein